MRYYAHLGGMIVTAVASKSSRLPEMSWIRGIAALIIMLFHYTTCYSHHFPYPWTFKLEGGEGAISIFFLLSGMLTVLSLKEGDRAGGYLWKRVKRLYPGYWVCIVLTAVVTHLFLPSHAYDAKTIAVNFTMLQWLFGYANVDGVYWTMQYELRFYLLIAVLLLLRQHKNIKWYAFLWVIASFVLYQLFFRDGVARRLVRLPAIWLMADSSAPFISGIFLACLLRNPRDWTAWIGLGLAVALAVFSQPSNHLTAHLCTAGAGLAAVVLRSLPATGERYRVAIDRLDRGPLKGLAWFASISYPFYLLHQYIGWAILQGIERAGLHQMWIILIPFAVCTGLAWMVHHFVEQKVR